MRTQPPWVMIRLLRHQAIVFVKPEKGAVGRLAEARRFFYDCCKN